MDASEEAIVWSDGDQTRTERFRGNRVLDIQQAAVSLLTEECAVTVTAPLDLAMRIIAMRNQEGVGRGPKFAIEVTIDDAQIEKLSAQEGAKSWRGRLCQLALAGDAFSRQRCTQFLMVRWRMDLFSETWAQASRKIGALS